MKKAPEGAEVVRLKGSEGSDKSLFDETLEFARVVELAGIEERVGVTTDLSELVSSELADHGSFFAQLIVNDDFDVVLNEFSELIKVLAGKRRHNFLPSCVTC